MDRCNSPILVLTLCLLSIFAEWSLLGLCKRTDQNEMNHCGSVKYDNSSSTCCNGILTHGLSQWIADCCHTKAFNPLNKICCRNQIMDRTSAQVKCCGSDTYLSSTHLCCGDSLREKKREKTLRCCNTVAFDNSTHKCCDNAILRELKEDCDNSYISNTRSHPHDSGPDLSQNPPSAQNNMHCAGKPYKRTSALDKCCGDKKYSLLGDVLCCNETLHTNVPEDSHCVGGVVYFPENSRCLQKSRLALGEHCCGERSFRPDLQICCNGRSNYTKFGHFCCGPDVYDQLNSDWKCCSGRLYSISAEEGAECCGTLLRKSDEACCSSASRAFLYQKQSNHGCCGHHYYNKSLWSCCAERLRPRKTQTPDDEETLRLKPLTELIPEKCKTVFLGKVESLSLDDSQRSVVVKVIMKGKTWSHNLPARHFSIDHCTSPALEVGLTYAWEEVKRSYVPISLSLDLTSDVHLFTSVCS